MSQSYQTVRAAPRHALDRLENHRSGPRGIVLDAARKRPQPPGTTTSPTSHNTPPNHPTAITVKPCGPQYTRQHGIRPHRNTDSNPAQSTVFEPAVSHHTAPVALRHSNSRHPSGTQHRLRTGNHTPPHLLQQPAYRPVASDPAAARTMRQPPNSATATRTLRTTARSTKSTPGPKTGGANETSRD